ncbi:biotin-dependent carboxyltransferase family protein [soil metagenome]
MSLTVLDPGFHTLVVDGGRRRSRHLGVPLGGAADRGALALANGLVGNDAEAAALEITMLGPTLQAKHRTACALFGSPFVLAVANKTRIMAGSAFLLEPGDAVKIGGSPSGARAYFAVAGGFDLPTILESRSALESLTVNSTLMCKASFTPSRGLPFDALPVERIENAVRIRVLTGPQYDRFLKPKEFFSHDYEVSPVSNRMGLRLLGTSLERRPGELASEAVAPGAVQVTNDGLPIVLGVDGQTIGGYPKIAHVIRTDLDLLGQLRPGDKVRFEKVTLEDAEGAAGEREMFINEWATRLRVTNAAVMGS